MPAPRAARAAVAADTSLPRILSTGNHVAHASGTAYVNSPRACDDESCVLWGGSRNVDEQPDPFAGMKIWCPAGGAEFAAR